jgi:hypothetical protein
MTKVIAEVELIQRARFNRSFFILRQAPDFEHVPRYAEPTTMAPRCEVLVEVSGVVAGATSAH